MDGDELRLVALSVGCDLFFLAPELARLEVELSFWSLSLFLLK